MVRLNFEKQGFEMGVSLSTLIFRSCGKNIIWEA